MIGTPRPSDDASEKGRRLDAGTARGTPPPRKRPMNSQLGRLERWARTRNWRLFVLLTETRTIWTRRSRNSRWSPFVAVSGAERRDAARCCLLNPNPDAEEILERILRARSRERPVVHDTPHLTIFRTTDQRTKQIVESAQGGDLAERRRRKAARAGSGR